ncbi:MAG: GAF domain-containing protein, partial [Proteobacteria bacterium]|nr:GAF domain-containing protein [Pseudomonadota bacterium]
MTSKNDYFKTFCKVSKAFGTTLREEELLDLIVQSAIDTMGGKAASLFLADEEKDVFVPVAQKGLSENYLHAGTERARKTVADILEGGYLSILDAATDLRIENREAKKAEGIASILVVPVMVRDKAIGILSLYTDSTRDFSNDDADFLTALAEQGGMAIEHA